LLFNKFWCKITTFLRKNANIEEKSLTLHENIGKIMIIGYTAGIYATN